MLRVDPTLKPRLVEHACTRAHKHTRRLFFWDVSIRNSLRSNKGQTPESDIPPSYCATMRYTNVHLGFCVRFSTLIGQIGRVPLFGAEPRRYMRSLLFRLAITAFWRALTASWRHKGKRKQRSFLGPLARQNCLRILRPDISEQPDHNLTDFFDKRNHGSQRLSARYEHTPDVLVTRTHTRTTRD